MSYYGAAKRMKAMAFLPGTPYALITERKGERVREVGRTPMPHHVREIAERGDGSVWLLEDGKEVGAGRLLRLAPR